MRHLWKQRVRWMRRTEALFHAEGTGDEICAVIITAYSILRYRFQQFLALPCNELMIFSKRLKTELDRTSILLP